MVGLKQLRGSRSGLYRLDKSFLCQESDPFDIVCCVWRTLLLPLPLQHLRTDVLSQTSPTVYEAAFA